MTGALEVWLRNVDPYGFPPCPECHGSLAIVREFLVAPQPGAIARCNACGREWMLERRVRAHVERRPQTMGDWVRHENDRLIRDLELRGLPPAERSIARARGLK